MIFISHRGNLDGCLSERENLPNYIDEALSFGFDVEIDFWYIAGDIYLGHDEPQYLVDLDWITFRGDKLWIHCKNKEAIVYLLSIDYSLNFFWHQNDLMTLTSKKNIWVYPGNQPIKKSIAVLPELNGDDIENCLGICSDFVKRYRQEYLVKFAE